MGRKRGKKATQENPTVLAPPVTSEVKEFPSSCKPPHRAGIGTAGVPIPLLANHFAVRVSNLRVFHYHLDISPLGSNKVRRNVIHHFFAQERLFHQIYPVYDGKSNIYTARRVPGLDCKMEFKYTLTEDTRERNFIIKIQPTGELEIDLGALQSYCNSKNASSINQPLRAIQSLDIALRYGILDRKIPIGNSLISKEIGRRVFLGNGVEAWFGHFQSLRLGWKPFLNVDVTQRAFVKSGLVHEIMADMYQTNIGEALYSPVQYKDFAKKINRLKVSYSRGAYTASIGCNGLKGPANKETFDCDGSKMTVQQYFESKYKTRLKYPHLPCVWVGTPEKNILVPMEICTIPEGQEYRHKLSDLQTTKLIKVAATPARVRKQKIIDSVKDMRFAEDQYLRSFGISVDTNMVQVKGRVLPTPKLLYGGTAVLTPRDGVWNMRDKIFVDARQMQHFGVINITKRVKDNDIHTFISKLSAAGRNMGMTIGNNLFIWNINERQLERNMKKAKEMFPKLEIIFVIINRKGDPAYETVKRVGDLELAITTQCVQFKNVLGRNGPDPSTLSNICLKLNAKLGGINSLIDASVRPKVLRDEQVIIMGADVTHPGTDQQNSGKASIAAVVGSIDPRASQYCAEIRIQASKQEWIEEMEGMVYNILLKFNRANRSTSTGKPQRIIFFRDGVSEGQFAEIIIREVSAIRKACLRLGADYRPPITFIVVQKRHHTRLFPENMKHEVGYGKNVPPGTVVDEIIVHPTENDFFLVSHLGIQGTSRPTHYHLLWDDSGFSSDDLQILTYYLCYLFARCTRSVSYPAPCYYSHLVAFRGRQYYDSLGEHLSSQDLQRRIDSCRELEFMFFV